MAKKMPWHRARAIRDMIESWTPQSGVKVTCAITANQRCERVMATLVDSGGHVVGVSFNGEAGLSSVLTGMDQAQEKLREVRRKCPNCGGKTRDDEESDDSQSESETTSSSTFLRTAPSVN